jgi:hypothetical protein
MAGPREVPPGIAGPGAEGDIKDYRVTEAL